MSNIIIAGIGGQNTALASKLLAQAALLEGHTVRTAETLSVAQPGSSALEHVRITRISTYGGARSGSYKDEPMSPLVPKGAGDLLIGFEPGETVRALPYLRNGGIVVTARQTIAPATTGTALVASPATTGAAAANTNAAATAVANDTATANTNAAATTDANDTAAAGTNAAATTGVRAPIALDRKVAKSYNGVAELNYLRYCCKTGRIEKLIIVDGAAVCSTLGSFKVLNVLLLGAALSTKSIEITKGSLLSALELLIPAERHELNRRALLIGMGLSDPKS